MNDNKRMINMSDIFQNDKPVYWDDERKQFYWIEWEETGNNDIPHRHYITQATILGYGREVRDGG